MLEHNPEPSNPLQMDGIEFVEYATSQPQALANVLQMMGFVAIARHRSREVTLFRQGPMNIIVNAHPAVIDLLKNDEREAVVEAEKLFTRRIELVPRKEYHLEQFDLQGR